MGAGNAAGYWYLVLEAKDAAEQFAMYSPHKKNYPTENVNSAKAQKCCHRIIIKTKKSTLV